MEECDSVDGFLLFNAYSGGTGSGMTSSILLDLEIHSKKPVLQFGLFPSRNLDHNVVSPYNSVLHHNDICNLNSVQTVAFDNESLYSICEKKLGIERPSLEHANTLIAHYISGLTSPLRFDGPYQSNLREIITSVRPFHNNYALIPSYVPFVDADKVHDTSSPSTLDMIWQTRDPSNLMLGVDLSQG